MDIEKLLEGQAEIFFESNLSPNKEFIDLETRFIKSLGENIFFHSYDSLRAAEEIKAIEGAYYEGIKTGLKLLNTVFNLGKLEVRQIEEAANGKRVS